MNIGKESEVVEYKKTTAELKEGIISLASMLNKSGKATLYFGVRNDGEVVGQQIGEDTTRKISEAIANSIEPAIIPSISEEHDPSGLSYIRIETQGSDAPYSAYGLYYVRSADQDKKATRESLRKMFSGSSFDFIRETEATRQDLHFSQLISLLTSKGFHISNQSTFIRNEKLLTDDGKFNQMAELLSDESDVSIKVVRFSGTNKTAMSQRKEFGNRCLILAMQQAMDYVEILDEVNVDVSGAQRRETPLFVFKAFREAWINACLHNSWNELTPPAIYLYSDRMEIVSYGGLPFGLSEEEFYRGESHPINKALQTIFTQLDYTEQTGHGVPSIIEAYSKEVFRISDHFISVTLPFAFKPEWVIAGEEEEQKEALLNKTQKLVFEYIKKNPDAVAESISKELGIGIATVNRNIGSLKKAGLIKRVGSRKAGHWTF